MRLSSLRPIRAPVEPQRHRIGGHAPIAAHQHHARGLGGGGHLVQPCAAGEGLGDIVAERCRGAGERLANLRSVRLGGGDGGGQAGDRSLPGRPAQPPCRLQQAKRLLLGLA